MRKKLLYLVAGLVAIVLVFFTGSIVGANMDWKTKAINDSYSGFLDIASEKVGTLTVNVDEEIEQKIQDGIHDSVEDKNAELERLLEEYYQMKLNNFTTTEDFKQLEQQIEEIMLQVADSYKRRIDEAFYGK